MVFAHHPPYLRVRVPQFKKRGARAWVLELDLPSELYSTSTWETLAESVGMYLNTQFEVIKISTQDLTHSSMFWNILKEKNDTEEREEKSA